MPYLHRLGISHCYASPLLTARPGSMHGYDITNHQELNAEIGSREDFDELIRTLREHDMGLILDIVPNHMGSGKDNPWWMDVLENGEASLYAEYFDIDWTPLADEIHGKVMVPILGNSYGEVLTSGELNVSFEVETGKFWLNYYEHRMPINPVSYPIILGHRLEVLEARLGNKNPALMEYQSINTAFDRLPLENKEERAREQAIATNRLLTLCAQTPEIAGFIEENLGDFRPKEEDPTNLNRLHRLLEAQAYRLANWRVASDEINYRRFFDVNDLVAVRVEDARVFDDTHALIMDLIEKGQLDGLRIDHPDGLFNPAEYFKRLQQEAAKRLKLENFPEFDEKNVPLGSDALPFYILIEKILAPYERLPEEWMVHGTTGYEFANSVNGVLIDREHEKEFTRTYERFINRHVEFESLVYYCKRLIMHTTLNSELGVLAHQLNRISERDWFSRDFTLHSLRNALVEVVASFPVYRTYVTPENVSKKDQEYVEWAIRMAKKRSTAIDTTIFDFIHKVLLLETPVVGDTPSEEQVAFCEAVCKFAMKFQQYTGPVMAKGLEDTTFYRYNRLVSLNEVGGEPKQFGISVIAFHHQNSERMNRVPHTMLSTSTHDTKRSEGVRARISVLSEMPDEWQKQVSRWRRLNRHRKKLTDKIPAPDPNHEYLLYQTIIGMWPVSDVSDAELPELIARIENYMLKAVKEAKTHTSWINPNTEYEEALGEFIRNTLSPGKASPFLQDMMPFHKKVARLGLFNSLTQTLLKLTSPGVPDIYQGTELWDFSLVDPDNRRPVDYQERQKLLDELSRFETPQKRAQYLVSHLDNGALKLYVIATVLNFRREHPELFKQGAYVPLEVTGQYSDNVVAFARQLEGLTSITVVPRLLRALIDPSRSRNEMPHGKRIWKDTAVILSAELGLASATGKNLLSEESIQIQGDNVPVADVLNQLPVAFLVFERKD